jgi:AmmeMemoRadiSam system protein B
MGSQTRKRYRILKRKIIKAKMFLSIKRKATHAGSWYSSDKMKLDSQLNTFFKNVPNSTADNSSLKAIIGPHAGLSYSGQTAAHAYSKVNKELYDLVFLIGPSHHIGFQGCSLSKFSGFSTPIGDLNIDIDTR